MFPELKCTVLYTGEGQASIVSIRADTPLGLQEVPSPTTFVGTGGCFGSALHNCIRNLDAYIEHLTKFRNEVLNNKRAYTEAVEIDVYSRIIQKR